VPAFPFGELSFAPPLPSFRVFGEPVELLEHLRQVVLDGRLSFAGPAGCLSSWAFPRNLTSRPCLRETPSPMTS
jgi:hypothetical protein